MAVYRNVQTRRLALIESFGLSPSEVIEGGVSEDYVTIVGDHRDRFPDSRIEVAHMSPVLTHVLWPDDDWRKKARTAIDGDWKESVSDTPHI